MVHNGRLVRSFTDRAGFLPGFPDTAGGKRDGIGIDVHAGFGWNIESDVHGVMEPPEELAVCESTVHGQRDDGGMICKVCDGLLHHLTSKLDIAHFDRCEPQCNRKAACRVPDHPDFEAKDGFHHLSDASLPSPQFGSFFFANLAASPALLRGLDFGRIHECMDFFGEEGMGRQDSHNAVEEPLQGTGGNGRM